jgi:hypothetical protein
MNKLILQLSVFAVFAALGVSFLSSAIVVHRNIQSIALKSAELDPNFEAHLPTLLKAGQSERPSAELASELRKKYKKIEQKKRDAAQQLKTVNAELAAELEEIADELQESHENFVAAAIAWDAWNRPSPDLPRELRANAEKEKIIGTQDPNFAAHVSDFMKAGTAERPSPDLPSELRMLKYKNMASVKRIAAKELKSKNINPALAEELDDLAAEMEESHEHFVQLANALKNKKF